MTLVWKHLQGVTISNLEADRFLFHFFHMVDYQRVLKSGPWSFNNNILILGAINEGEDPANILLFYVPFWIQVSSVPIEFVAQTIREHMGNYIG